MMRPSKPAPWVVKHVLEACAGRAVDAATIEYGPWYASYRCACCWCVRSKCLEVCPDCGEGRDGWACRTLRAVTARRRFLGRFRRRVLLGHEVRGGGFTGRVWNRVVPVADPDGARGILS